MLNLRLAVNLKRDLFLDGAQDSLEPDDYKGFLAFCADASAMPDCLQIED
jgi:hypothetical protein